MYISEFVCGVIAGAVAEFVVLVALAVWLGRNGKKK